VDGNLNTLRNDLETFAALGMEAVEIPVHGLDAIRGGVLDIQRLQDILRILNDFNFSYSVHSPNPLNLMDEQQPDLHLSVFKATLDFAAAIAARAIVYHAGRFIPEEAFGLPYPPDQDPKRGLRLLDMEMEKLSRVADEYPRTVIAVENARPYLYHSPYCYGERLDSLKGLVEQINRPNVRITLDIGHLYMSSRFYGFDPVEAVHGLRDLIAHTHIHDNFGGSIYYNEKIQTHQIPFGRGDSHMPVGWGRIPFTDILSEYIQSYAGMWIMELRNRYFKDLKESRANLIRLLKHFRSATNPSMGILSLQPEQLQ